MGGDCLSGGGIYKKWKLFLKEKIAERFYPPPVSFLSRAILKRKTRQLEHASTVFHEIRVKRSNRTNHCLLKSSRKHFNALIRVIRIIRLPICGKTMCTNNFI